MGVRLAVPGSQPRRGTPGELPSAASAFMAGISFTAEPYLLSLHFCFSCFRPVSHEWPAPVGLLHSEVGLLAHRAK